jgi:phosphoenolpyruvate phosphomutase
MKKTTQFKQLLHSGQVEFLLEAHNGLSAKIVEESGFKGIWGSGLSISASLGVRDSNEASWTQVLEVLEFMSDATSIPILLDGDTGYGNFNNVRRLVRKLEQRSVAAVCIEDKLFPKTNSFIAGEQQPLADLEEFSNKIKAAKDAQLDSDFCVIARVEALIAGWGLTEALKRADAYHRAGADGILIHSKLPAPDQILAFMREWKNTGPVVIVPTTYFNTPTSVFEESGISIVIWANHLLRSSLSAMQLAAQKIHRDRSLAAVEADIVPVKEIFRIQDDAELRAAEKKYLPARQTTSTKAVLLASQKLAQLNGNGQSAAAPYPDALILSRLVSQFNDAGIKEIILVGGNGLVDSQIPGLKVIDKIDDSGQGEIASLLTALQHINGTMIISRADTLYEKHILLNLQNEPGDIVLVKDVELKAKSRLREPAVCLEAAAVKLGDLPSNGDHRFGMKSDKAGDGWVGLCKLSPAGAELLLDAIRAPSSRPRIQMMDIPELFDYIGQQHVPTSNFYISGHWQRIGDTLQSAPAANLELS